MCVMATPSRIVITGIDGFTGQHLARRLERAGWQVFGMAGPGTLPMPDTLTADLREGDRIAEWLSEIRPSHVVHLAALSHVVGPPLPFYETNVLGTEALLNAIDRSGSPISKLVIASSANIYGQSGGGAIGEDRPPLPANHYALSKLAMEHVARQWFDRLPILLTRPFNYTGPGQSEAFLYAKLVGAFHRREPRLKLGNLSVARDLSSVDFVALAYERLLECDLAGDVFNICSGRSVSISEALEILRDLTGHDPEIVSDPLLVRDNDIDVLTGDPTRLQKAIGPIEPTPPRKIFSGMLDAMSAMSVA